MNLRHLAAHQGVPESVGFDIEVKMTTPDNLPAAPAAEVERMVSAILDTVRWTGGDEGGLWVAVHKGADLQRRAQAPWHDVLCSSLAVRILLCAAW